MPKGQKTIDWTHENDLRLLLTILAIENIHPNCDAVAAAFGNSVNAMAISNRLSRLRKKAVDEGLTGAGVVGKGPGAGKKGGKKAGGAATATTGHEDHADSTPAPKARAKSQKVLTGRVTKTTKPVKSEGKSFKRASADVEEDAAEADDEDEGKGEEDVAAGIKTEEGD